MPASIILRTIATVDDKRVVLANSPGARTMLMGNGWNVARVGLRLCLNDPVAATITESPVFFMGFCSGSANKYGMASVTHAFGMKVTSASWTRNAGTPNYYGPLSMFPCKKVLTVETVGGSAIDTTKVISATPASHRTVWVVELTKGSPNYTINGVFPTSAQVSDISQATFRAAMEDATLSGCAATLGMSAGTARTQAVSEADGNLDSLGLFWGRTGPTIEVSHILATRVS